MYCVDHFSNLVPISCRLEENGVCVLVGWLLWSFVRGLSASEIPQETYVSVGILASSQVINNFAF